MYIQAVKYIIISRHLSMADVARLAGVSRAAVSKWFSKARDREWVNVETRTVFELAKNLGIEPAFFFQRMEDTSRYRIKFLWDNIYPDMEQFILALTCEGPEAIARLVQVLGFRKAQRIIGMGAVSLFGKYKKYIKPARRKQLEVVWPLYRSKAGRRGQN